MRIEHTVHMELRQKYNKLLAFVESLTMPDKEHNDLILIMLQLAGKDSFECGSESQHAHIALRARQVLEEIKSEL